MKKIIYIICSYFLISCTQTVTRWANKKSGFKNMQLSVKSEKNIFDDYLWSMPDYGKIKVRNNTIEYNDFKYHLKQINEDSIQLELNDQIICSSSKQVSDSTIYFDKSSLASEPVSIYRWVPVTTFQTKSVPVTYSEPQMNYRTDYSYGGGYRTFTYITYNIKTRYEMRTVPVTNWQYQSTTEYRPIIPSYKYFNCKIGDSDILIYQVKDQPGNSFTYYFQNPGYLITSDSSNTNYILVDYNSNGKYDDLNDLFMATSWNPYDEKSSYKESPVFLQNNWYKNSFLMEELFLEINYDQQKLNITSPNSRYSHDSTATLLLENIPDEARLQINGKYYRTKEGRVKLKNQFGKFKLTIERDGFLDFHKVYEINHSDDKVVIKYEETPKSGLLKISNIFSNNYFVTVSNEQSKPKTLHNPKSINLPIGKNEITIQTSGFSFVEELNIEQGQEYEIDFEAELNKLNNTDED